MVSHETRNKTSQVYLPPWARSCAENLTLLDNLIEMLDPCSIYFLCRLTGAHLMADSEDLAQASAVILKIQE